MQREGPAVGVLVPSGKLEHTAAAQHMLDGKRRLLDGQHWTGAQ